MTHIDHELQRLERQAICTASRTGLPSAIYNLNAAGPRLLCVRDYSEGPPPYAGPFQPRPRWQAEFPDYPADAIPMLGSDWRDDSWHNDECPAFIHEPSGIVLWCGWPGDDVASRYTFAQMEAVEGLGFQHGNDSSVLECSTLNDVRDVLDHMADDSTTLPDALRSGRMRLNQLTVADAREFIAIEILHDLAGGRGCPDLVCGMRDVLAKIPCALSLDGADARLRLAGKFGFVRRADGKGGEVEFSAIAVARVLDNGGAFQS